MMNAMAQHPMPQLNLVLAWAWVVLGFGSGMILGLLFHDEGWMGGYASWRRRLYRLGHISFFGLAIINLMFYVTAEHLDRGKHSFQLASLALVVGAVSMPVCCLLAAHVPKTRLLFSVPITSLLTGATLTLIQILLP